MGDGPNRTPADLLVLHTLRCTGSATADRLVTILGDDADLDVESELLSLAATGAVHHRAGEFGGWHLTDDGKVTDAVRIAEELDRMRARDEVSAGYAVFLDLNPLVLDVCSAWQVRIRDGVPSPNDRRDQAYDGRVLDQFALLDAEAADVCRRLTARLSRFGRYRPRLATALARARAGDPRQVTDTLDAYHTVWFQLHEDLLVTLGRPRT